MSNSISFFHLLLSLCFIQLSVLSSLSGFMVDLINRDSTLSPLYNASKTKSDRLRSALIRSHSRAAYLRDVFSKSEQNYQAPAIPNDGEYLIKMSIGTPPTPIYCIIDTGSDLTWTQCSPCEGCYIQSLPLFDPNESSTYKPVLFNSNSCQTLQGVNISSSPKSNICQYQVNYGGGTSFSLGEVAVETFTFGTTSVQNLIFGCGHNNRGSSAFKDPSTGIVGLASGKGSFASQIGGPTNGKFSYCLVNQNSEPNATSKISFGEDSVVYGPGVVSSPIVRYPGFFSDRYALTLEAVKLGNKTSTTSGHLNVNESKIIIDSGTTFTYILPQLMNNLQEELKKAVIGRPTPDPEGGFKLCYNKTSVKIYVPPITFQFTGATLDVPHSNAFVEIDGGLLCLGILPNDESDFFVLGNMVQMNVLVGYDLVANKISFKPTDCSKHGANECIGGIHCFGFRA